MRFPDDWLYSFESDILDISLRYLDDSAIDVSIAIRGIKDFEFIAPLNFANEVSVNLN